MTPGRGVDLDGTRASAGAQTERRPLPFVATCASLLKGYEAPAVWRQVCIHADRIARRHCYHCHFSGAAIARPRQGQAKGHPHLLSEQSETDRHRRTHLRRRKRRPRHRRAPNKGQSAGPSPSFSPIKLAAARPFWTLAADSIVRSGSLPWGRFDPSADRDIFEGVPPHRGSLSALPAGANQVFADGSAQWIKAERLRFFHSWSVSGRRCYFFQERSDLPDNLLSQLENPSMTIGP